MCQASIQHLQNYQTKLIPANVYRVYSDAAARRQT